MKAILKFNLDDPDDVLAHRRCISATEAYLVILEIGERLRIIEKRELIVTPSDMRKEFYGLLEDRGIDLDHLQ